MSWLYSSTKERNPWFLFPFRREIQAFSFHDDRYPGFLFPSKKEIRDLSFHQGENSWLSLTTKK
jgi:hypothetical protein